MNEKNTQIYETFRIGPPFKGYLDPTGGFTNPLLSQERFEIMSGMHIQNKGEYLRLFDGWGTVLSGLTSAKVRMLTSYKSTTRNDLIYVDGNNLKYWDLNGSSGGTVTQISNGGAATTCRVAVVRFRNRFLIGLLKDSTPATYGGLWWYDPENRTAQRAGVAAPGSAATLGVGAAGLPNGSYKGYVSFVTADAHESNLSPVSNTVSVSLQKISWTSIPTGGANVTKRRLYRTVSAGTTPLFLAEIADNSTTTFTDNIADSGLGSPNEGNNTPPPDGIRNLAVLGNRVYLAADDGVTVYASKTDATTVLPNYEAYPYSQTYSFVGGEDALKAITPIGQALFVWGSKTSFRTLGDFATGNTSTETLPWNVGMFSPHSWTMTPKGLLMIDVEKKLRLFDGVNVPRPVATHIWNLFANLTQSNYLEGPSMVYHELYDKAFISTLDQTIGTYDHVCLDLDTEEATASIFELDPMHYKQDSRLLYGHQSKSSSANIWVTNTSDYHLNPGGGGATSSVFLGSRAISPLPGEQVYFVRLVFIIKALPLISGVLPMIRVQYSLNNASWFEETYHDVSSDFLTYPRPASDKTAIQRVVQVPIYKTGESLKFWFRTISSSNNVSVINGFEIYSAEIHWKPLSEARMGSRTTAEAQRLTTGVFSS